jgi:hypothetical protein
MQPLFPIAVYLLCLLTSVACAWLLSRSYRRTRARLLLWSSLCFTLLAVNNLLLVADMVLLPNVDLRVWRMVPMLLAVGVLLFGFIWDLEEER